MSAVTTPPAAPTAAASGAAAGGCIDEGDSFERSQRRLRRKRARVQARRRYGKALDELIVLLRRLGWNVTSRAQAIQATAFIADEGVGHDLVTGSVESHPTAERVVELLLADERQEWAYRAALERVLEAAADFRANGGGIAVLERAHAFVVKEARQPKRDPRQAELALGAHRG